MDKVSYDAIGPSVEVEKLDHQTIIFGEHIFQPELECVAVLVHYLGSDVEKKQLVMKMIGCDFHLDAIEKVKALSEKQYSGFISNIEATLLNSQHESFVGLTLLEEFKENCTSCCK